VWRLLVVLPLLAIALIIPMLPVQTHLTLSQQGWQATLQIEITIAWVIKLRRAVDISHNVAIAAEHMLKRWRATGEPVKIPLQKTVRRFPGRRVLKALRKPIRYFRKRLKIRRLDVHMEVGGYDAMQSALLSGFSWSLIGTLLAQVSRLVRLDPAVPRVHVVPVFANPAYLAEVDCIAQYRLGNAIFAGVWLLWRAVWDREIRAWARDSWRRKGVEGGGRASDSGLDEDGHGEPEGHGRREHRGR
jgi:hypothetical protein